VLPYRKPKRDALRCEVGHLQAWIHFQFAGLIRYTGTQTYTWKIRVALKLEGKQHFWYERLRRIRTDRKLLGHRLREPPPIMYPQRNYKARPRGQRSSQQPTLMERTGASSVETCKWFSEHRSDWKLWLVSIIPNTPPPHFSMSLGVTCCGSP
jgi:hypothetical protein